jgi:PRC-barrel domain
VHAAFPTAALVAVIVSLAGPVQAQAPDSGRQTAQDPAPPAAAPSAPAPAAPAAPPDAQPPGPAGTPATVLDDQQVVAILGKSVRGREGEDMGRIVDVIVNRSGQVRAAVIDFGGFLGVGSRRVAVDWSALRFEPTGKPDRITLDLTRNSVRLAPEYKEGAPVVVLGTSATAQPSGGAPTDAPKDK